MAFDEKVLKKVKKISDKKDKEEILKNLKKGIQSTEETLKLGDKAESGMIPEEIMKDLLKYKKQNKDGGKQKLKDGAKPDFLDFDKDGNKSESMKSALASKKTKTAKSGARTTMRGVKIAKKGYRKAKLS